MFPVGSGSCQWVSAKKRISLVVKALVLIGFKFYFLNQDGELWLRYGVLQQQFESCVAVNLRV